MRFSHNRVTKGVRLCLIDWRDIDDRWTWTQNFNGRQGLNVCRCGVAYVFPTQPGEHFLPYCFDNVGDISPTAIFGFLAIRDGWT